MWQHIQAILQGQNLIPHGYCLSWNPALLWTFVISDLSIALSYFSIPFALFYFGRRRPDVAHRSVMMLFGIFIVACGMTHLLDVVNIWIPDYWPGAAFRIVTAIASVFTAVILWRLMPEALRAPSTQQLEAVNNELEKSHAELELRVEERTRELRDALTSTKRLSAALDKMSVYVYMKNAEREYVYANRVTLDLFQVTPDALYGSRDERFFSPETAAQLEAIDRRVLDSGENTAEEVISSAEDGTKRYFWEIKTPIYDDAVPGRVWGLCGISTDITEKKQSEELIWRQANFDSLTGLPNRRMVQDRLEQEVRKCHRLGTRVAVLFIDLDQFKAINDTYGHDEGDLLLRMAATRIMHCIRETDTLGRLGGDEFIVILSDLEDYNSIGRIAEDILRRLNQPFELGNEVVYVSGSLGITIGPDDGDTVSILLRNADQAMYAAKHQGRNQFSYYTAVMQREVSNRMQLIKDLHLALDQEQFELYFQPIVELATGSINKAEALLRWNHPTRGVVGPQEFIHVAEETGLIHVIGEWVFGAALRQLKVWRTHKPEFQISVNKSPLQLKFNLKQHFESVMARLDKVGLPPQSIVMEITESLLMEAGDETRAQFIHYRDHGIQVALDDFGTGYSSLSYLQEFDIDYIKIDQSFVHNLAQGSNTLSLCEAMIVMAHKLGIKVIAEGVETEEQRALLAAAGCDYVQGYLYSRPISAVAFERAYIQGGDS